MNRVALFMLPPALLALWTVVASWVTVYGLGVGGAIPYPSWQWWGYLMAPMPDAMTAAFVERWLSNGALAASAFTFLVAFRLVTKFGAMGFGKPALHGASKFGTVEDGRRVGLIYSRHPRPDSLILGRTKGLLFGMFPRYVGLPRHEHVMIYAKSRSGKGVGYVVPNCFNYENSLVVLDIKGENHACTAAHRENMGQEVFLFSPLAEDKNTHRWNPLGDITSDNPEYLNKLHSMAFEFFPEVADKTKFWQDKARTAFYGIAALIAETPGMNLNPGEVLDFFVRNDATARISQMVEDRRASGNPCTQACINAISDYLRGDFEVVEGTRNHVTSTMGLWFNPTIRAATAHSDFDLADLRKRKMTIYVSVTPEHLRKLGVLLRLFFLQLTSANMHGILGEDPEIRHPCHVMLDEFTSLGPMYPIAEAVPFSIAYGLHFSFVVQSKLQIKEKYKGKGEADLFGNMSAEIIFGTNDQILCKEASERAGYDTVTALTRTAPRFWSWWRRKEQNQTEHQHRRALLLPQEVARMPAGMELVFCDTAPPFMLNRLKWYQDPWFRDLEAPPPVAPLVSYVLAADDGSVQIMP